MNPVTVIGLSKLLVKLASFARLPAGEYSVNEVLTLRVHGKLIVGQDGEYVPTSSIPWKKTLALFLRYSGVTREKALAALAIAMRDAFEKDESAEDLLDAMADLDEAEEQINETLSELPKKFRKGAVNVKELHLEEVRRASVVKKRLRKRTEGRYRSL